MQSSASLRRLFATRIKSSNSYEDKALQWARRNPELAQECLHIPSSVNDEQMRHETDNRTCATSIFSDYWARRKWRFPSSLDKQEKSMAEGLATHVLSAPLTVAKFISNLLQSPIHTSHATTFTRATNQQKWCCIGARAEASLPVQYWREVLVVLSWLNHANAPVQVQLDFIGPEVLQRPPLTLSYMDATLKLQWTFSGKFHEMDPAHASSYDAYILLNPGLGHDHLMVDWKPSIDLLLGCSAPKLLTAHSKLDASRDAKVLSDYFLASSLDYELNPFASRITYQDPFDSSHMVQPNHYVLQLSDENIK